MPNDASSNESKDSPDSEDLFATRLLMRIVRCRTLDSPFEDANADSKDDERVKREVGPVERCLNATNEAVGV